METLTEFQKTLLGEVLEITGNEERLIDLAVERVISVHRRDDIKDPASRTFLRNLLKRHAKKAIEKHRGAPKQEQLL